MAHATGAPGTGQHRRRGPAPGAAEFRTPVESEETCPGTGQRYADRMHSPRTLPLLSSALVSVALMTAAGCSSSSSTTTTTAPKTTTSTTNNPLDLPATGSVDGVTLSVTSSPLTGMAG